MWSKRLNYKVGIFPENFPSSFDSLQFYLLLLLFAIFARATRNNNSIIGTPLRISTNTTRNTSGVCERKLFCIFFWFSSSCAWNVKILCTILYENSTIFAGNINLLFFFRYIPFNASLMSLSFIHFNLMYSNQVRKFDSLNERFSPGGVGVCDGLFKYLCCFALSNKVTCDNLSWHIVRDTNCDSFVNFLFVSRVARMEFSVSNKLLLFSFTYQKFKKKSLKNSNDIWIIN